MPFQFTEEQRAAVENRGGELLVSAAAGSGKTRVLVERLLRYVEEDGENIDAFPVITYTRAAAAELRARIAKELSERAALHPGDAHLRRQLTRLHGAQISTIHALCASLLREFGHLLDVDPDFRLCTEDEAAVLKSRALNDVLEARYETVEEGSDFALLVDTMAAGRDDSRLAQIVFDIYDKVQSHPDPHRWLKEQEDCFDLPEGTGVEETPWGAYLLADAAETAAYWHTRMEEARSLAAMDEVLEKNYGASIDATLTALEGFQSAVSQGWDATCATLPVPFSGVGRKGGAAEEISEAMKAIRTNCKKQLDKLAERFDCSSAELLADLRTVHPAVRGLFALVRDFETAYAAGKAKRGLLDFSDLEHLTVRLLTAGEERCPNALAEELSGRWREVMVDEYQDTNEVQNAIFNALSHGSKSLFMVGDVKQSIYRFRLADPTIFLKKYNTFLPAAEAPAGVPRKAVLSRNFRSRPEVLESANFLFRSLMSQELGEMEYTADDALYPGLEEYPAAGDCRTELVFLDRPQEKDDDGEERPDKSQMEARWAAERIERLLQEGFPVRDGGGLRAVRPSDIAILMRSPSTVLPQFTGALDERGIPWRTEQGEDFFATTEVSTALALLQIVDNPRQDVPLIAALRSPVYGFSGDRLALLRAQARNTDFYGAVETAAERGEEDCTRFLAELQELRRDAGEYAAHDLLWRLYEQTNLMGLFSALGEGERRRDNLLSLYELARSCEGNGYCGLFGFLSYLERLRTSGGSLPAPKRSRGEGVTLMSIHRSKGLEFPVVLLCGLARQMNREDMKKPILFHAKLGVGPQLLDTERMLQSPTLARTAVARKLEQEMMAEELRLLYVAVTRAQDKLILSVAPGRGVSALKKAADDLRLPVPPRALMGCESVGQWVLKAALCRPDGRALRAAAEYGGQLPHGDVDFGPEWDIKVVDGAPYLTEPPARQRQKAESERPVEAPEKLVEQFRWRYPHAAVMDVPSKLTATQLKGREKDSETAEDAPPPPPAAQPLRRPRFVAEEMGLTPAQRGTAQHLAMQFLDFDRTDSLTELQEEIARLKREQYLTPQQAEAVEPEKLLRFFQSELGQGLKRSKELHREFKFSLLSPAERYYGEAAAGEQVLMQGVVDCWFAEEDGVTVVDFKTDRVTEGTVARRAEEYRPQIEAYSEALARIAGRKVERRVLWFFALDRAVEL
ncbi:MAG: helicase-exonuclease AddAB subunit AddA [Oscillospiraceae bacterium]|nr:helicase-exonuclease AddAB subunit AddA [Oscillospiraceae bacterium]